MVEDLMGAVVFPADAAVLVTGTAPVVNGG